MHKPLLTSLIVLFCLFSYGTIIYLVRSNTPTQTNLTLYQTWRRHYCATTTTTAWVKTDTNQATTTLSEAHGYGMLLAVIYPTTTNHRLFERYYHYYLNHRSRQTQLMAWRQNRNHTSVTNTYSATDGDIMIAAALIIAAKQWHEVKFAHQAQKLLTSIYRYEFNHTTNLPTLGNWVKANSPLAYRVRTSDLMPQFFQLFYRFSHHRYWQTSAHNSLQCLKQLASYHSSGLIGEFAQVKFTHHLTSHPLSPAYGYSAARIPLNLASYPSKNAQAVITKMLTFFSKQRKITANYNTSGRALTNYQTAVFGAPLYYAALNNQYHHFTKVAQLTHHQATAMPLNNYYAATLLTYAHLKPQLDQLIKHY